MKVCRIHSEKKEKKKKSDEETLIQAPELQAEMNQSISGLQTVLLLRIIAQCKEPKNVLNSV